MNVLALELPDNNEISFSKFNAKEVVQCLKDHSGNEGRILVFAALPSDEELTEKYIKSGEKASLKAVFEESSIMQKQQECDVLDDESKENTVVLDLKYVL